MQPGSVIFSDSAAFDMERHQEVWDQLTGYALGELSGELRQRVEVHLASCAECTLEARQLVRAFDAVALSSSPIAPPSSLRARMLNELRSHRVPEVGPLAPAPMVAAAPGWSAGWLAVAAATVLVLGGLLALSQQRTARLLEAREAAEANIARLTEEASTVAAQADLAVSILTAPDMRRIDLQGFDASRDATARVYWSGTKGLLIVADRLPSPPPGRLYQVWLIGAEAPGPVSAGLIDGQSGRGMLIVPPPGGVTGRSITVAVTDEPAGGLPAPSGAKHLAGSM